MVDSPFHLPPEVKFVSYSRNHLVVEMTDPGLSTVERGEILLDLEESLRRKLDSKIEVFLKPQGDLNQLRVRLRGVRG